MRKITQNAVNAFLSGKNFCEGNTTVTVETNNPFLVHMYLHGNLIAKRYTENGEDVVMVSDAGWPTSTTKELLNGIPGVSIQQKSGQWFLNGNSWSGEWTKV